MMGFPRKDRTAGVTQPEDLPHTAERKAAADKIFAEAMARTDAAMHEGLGVLRIRSAGLAAGIPEETIAKSQENFLAMEKRHEAPGPAQVSPETVEKIRTHDAIRMGPLGKNSLVDDAITGTPALILPLPATAPTLIASIELIESLAATMGLPGKAELHPSDTPHQILLRWVAK